MLAFWMRSGSLSPEDGLLSAGTCQMCISRSPCLTKLFISTHTWQSMTPAVPQQRFSNSVSCPSGRSLALWKVRSTVLHLMWSVYFEIFYAWQEAVSRSMSIYWGYGGYPNTNCWSSTHCVKFWVSSSI